MSKCSAESRLTHFTTTTTAATKTHYVKVGPDIQQAMRDILKLLDIDDHMADDDEIYEAFLAGNYAGCATCQAAFIARAVLEGKEYPRKGMLA